MSRKNILANTGKATRNSTITKQVATAAVVLLHIPVEYEQVRKQKSLGRDSIFHSSMTQ